MPDFSAGQPIGPTQIQELQTKLESMCESLQENATRVFCAPVDTGIMSNEDCYELPSELYDENSINTGVEDKKLFSLTIDPNLRYTSNDDTTNTVDEGTGNTTQSSSSNYNANSEYRIRIFCGSQQIYSTGYISSNEIRSLQYITDCPRDDQIQICVDTRVVGGPSYVFTNLSTVKICGFVLCVAEIERDLSGLYKPPPFDPNCCHGREALCLASQNLDAICDSLIAERDQLVQCQTVEINDDGSVLLIGNTTGQTDYVVFGSVQICVRNNNPDTDYALNVDPVIGCQSDSVACLGISQEIRRSSNDGGDGPLVCLTVPVSACGSCPAGEDIYAGLTVDEICAQDIVNVQATSGLEIVSIRQTYCAWVFTEADISTLPDASDVNLGNCLLDTDLIPLATKCDQLEEFVNDRVPPNCTSRDLGQFEAVSGQDYIMQPAQAWPPPTPPPRPNPDPPPLKKWNVSLVACADVFRFDFGQPSTINATLTISVKCGGTVLATETVSWLAFQIGGTEIDQVIDTEERCLTINQCVECPIDEDLSICVESFVDTNFAPNIPNNAEVLTASMFCF